MIRDESGKLVLESALLYPLILMFTLGALFVALGAGVHTAVYVKSDAAASRAAFVWDNSHRNPMSGAFFPGRYDDLYWRLTGDFNGAGLAEKKLNASIAAFDEIPDKQGTFHNWIWLRRVHTAFSSHFAVPDWLQKWTGVSSLNANAASVVTEPAEWIRGVDMIRLYWPLVKDAITPQKADEIVDEFRKRPGSENTPIAFNTHNEARAYLQQTVNGRLAREETDEVGDWRLIDALDNYNIAHQAYFGMKTSNNDMKEQMEKDAELLRKGKVKGVTWHFFRRSRDNSIGLSDALSRQLQERGIVVVVHE